MQTCDAHPLSDVTENDSSENSLFRQTGRSYVPRGPTTLPIVLNDLGHMEYSTGLSVRQ